MIGDHGFLIAQPAPHGNALRVSSTDEADCPMPQSCQVVDSLHSTVLGAARDVIYMGVVQAIANKGDGNAMGQQLADVTVRLPKVRT